MEPLSVSVMVSPEGALDVVSWRNDARAPATSHRVRLQGLDGEVLRLFERWLTLRDRIWTEQEIRVFGQLLHRRLFPSNVWTWLLGLIDNRGQEIVHLMLAFPADADSSGMAALPWEYLCAPDRPGVDGQFLVLTPGLLLSRSVPPGTAARAPLEVDRIRILPVVGDSTNEGLGIFEYDEVEVAIRAAAAQRDFEVLDTRPNATIGDLAEAIRDERPHVVQYLGHAHFDKATGLGSVALRATDGGTDWVDERNLARALCTDDWAPGVVVLHACEGGVNDYDYRHAGLAPSLVRQGVQAVVAMQYEVWNSIAVEFSKALYGAIAGGQFLDESVQTARRTIWQDMNDARLLGIPMVYQRSPTPLLGPPADRLPPT